MQQLQQRLQRLLELRQFLQQLQQLQRLRQLQQLHRLRELQQLLELRELRRLQQLLVQQLLVELQQLLVELQQLLVQQLLGVQQGRHQDLEVTAAVAAGEEPVTNGRIKGLVCTSAIVAVLSAVVGAARPPASREVQEPWQRQTFAAFSLQRSFPIISNGYLLAHKRTVTAETHKDAVFVLTLKTRERRTIPFQLPGAFEIRLETAAVRANGNVLLGGSYTRSADDAAAATFVAELAQTGDLVARYDLANYLPERLCAAPDGGFWTFGQNFTQEHAGADYALLRRYSARGALVREYFQRSVLPAGVTLDYTANSKNVALLACGDTSVAAYVGRGTPPKVNLAPRFVWFEVNTRSGEARTLAVRNPGGAAGITGLVLSEGTAYASYEKGGLFTLTSDGSIGTWTRVPIAVPEGTVPAPPGVLVGESRREFGLLLGRDGDSLVHLRGRLSPRPIQTVYWSRLTH